MMTLCNVPRDAPSRLIQLNCENMCDACKTLQDTEDKQRKSRSKKKFVQPWFATTGRLCRSRTIIKHILVLDNLAALGYKFEVPNEINITSTRYCKPDRIVNHNHKKKETRGLQVMDILVVKD